MARKVEVHLIDDLDGGKAEETLTFSLDGTNYEIDLSKKNSAKLRTGLQPFLKVARKIPRTPGHRIVGRSRGAAPARSDREQNRAVREWAQRNGIEISPRGRISRTVIEQYEAEAGR